MKNSLRRGEFCPLHKSFFCCGRETPFTRKNASQRFKSSPAVEIIQDEHHPRGFREICSPAELRRRKHVLLSRGIKDCFYCEDPLTTYQDTELAHKEPKGMGGARHDDHWDNLALAHRLCNRENGSKRPAA